MCGLEMAGRGGGGASQDFREDQKEEPEKLELKFHRFFFFVLLSSFFFCRNLSGNSITGTIPTQLQTLGLNTL